MQNFDYRFNVGGDFTERMNGMNEATETFHKNVEGVQSAVVSFSQKLAAFELASGYVERVANTFEGLSSAGVRLDSQMHDLSAVAGVTGDALKEIEGYARDSAKAFGTDASVAVEGYKLLLSQLTPELGKCPEALKNMGESIQITSKLMGGDGVAAAQVLTTAMNQYGVSLEDPIEASKVMADMMNVMAAAGQAGSAELPAISAALAQCGMAAKAANVSFEETNAAIQVLDKAGKKASEGGVALRNTLAILGQGRFLPKDTREELERAGIDVLALADKNKSLKERLEMLKPVLNDSALFSKLFGMENANAARALVQGTDKLAEFTEAVTGTSSAEEQAAIVMDSYAEKQARINQQIEDVKISIFEATGGATLWAGALSGVLVPIAQMAPLLAGGAVFDQPAKLTGTVADTAKNGGARWLLNDNDDDDDDDNGMLKPPHRLRRNKTEDAVIGRMMPEVRISAFDGLGVVENLLESPLSVAAFDIGPENGLSYTESVVYGETNTAKNGGARWLLNDNDDDNDNDTLCYDDDNENPAHVVRQNDIKKKESADVVEEFFPDLLRDEEPEPVNEIYLQYLVREELETLLKEMLDEEDI